MSSSILDTHHKVVKFVQELLTDEDETGPITPVLINEKIDQVLAMKPKWGDGIDRELVTGELIRRFSLWFGHDATLQSGVGHVAWLSSGRKADWRYWQRYREWSEGKLSIKAVDALDRSTDSVLGLLEDPRREGAWDRRGLVVGHVQSGKTGNYTGLICKAADAGYKIIIVLAGLHNNLRSQTQMRLDEGFLGYETKPIADEIRAIGVGEIDRDPSIRPNYATNRSDSGDFNTKFARNLGISPEQRPWLFVVKKNKTVLDRLNTWIRNHVADATDPDTGRRIVTNLPLLVIDDEADNASVDTGEQLFGSDGLPDPDHEPKAINRLIRRMLHTFSRSAYVGYTATPFANIFIHERNETPEYGPDLFPSSFIISLAAPSSYVGPSKVFGLAQADGRRIGLPLFREVKDFTSTDGRGGWMPLGHRNGHRPLHDGIDQMPPSLGEAVDAFILACAVRSLRGQGREHSSMLVHVTRFNSVQEGVSRQVEEYVRTLRQRLNRNTDVKDLLNRLHDLWERDFVPTTVGVMSLDPDQHVAPLPAWEEILAILADVTSDIEVRMINGTAKDALDYTENAATGLKVIAIGGDKLARGLTLEGLSVSYFLRASKMYDTLMQMGRWFGYRPGYLDLCRLYTTRELYGWFGHIADAAEELREEFDLMAASGASPREYGLKVESHNVMLVTSRLKMRSARNLLLSFSGQLLETTSLYTDEKVLERNIVAVRNLIGDLGEGETDPVRMRAGGRQEWKGRVWQAVPATKIVEFLNSYRTHPAAHKVNSPLIAQFIESMKSHRELTSWTVALIGGGKGGRVVLSDGVAVDSLVRTANDPTAGYSIGRLLSPRDEAIDLSEEEWSAALAMTRAAWRADPARMQKSDEPAAPNGPAVRRVRGFGVDGISGHRERGLLLLYAITGAERTPDTQTPPVIAFGISFPGSDSGVKVEYKVNNVLWEQEYGSSE